MTLISSPLSDFQIRIFSLPEQPHPVHWLMLFFKLGLIFIKDAYVQNFKNNTVKSLLIIAPKHETHQTVWWFHFFSWSLPWLSGPPASVQPVSPTQLTPYDFPFPLCYVNWNLSGILFSFLVYSFIGWRISFNSFLRKSTSRCAGNLAVTSVTSLIARVDSADLAG